MEIMGGVLVALVLGAGIGALFGALLVMIATRIVAGFTPTYGNAFKAAFWGCIAYGIVNSAIQYLILIAQGESHLLETFGGLISFFVFFIVQSFVYAFNIQSPESQFVGSGAAIIIALVQAIVYFAILFSGQFIAGGVMALFKIGLSK